MSVICVVKKNHISCLSADTLTTFGSTKESAKQIVSGGKIITSQGNLIGVVGHASMDMILEIFLTENHFELSSKKKIFEMMLQFHQHLKDHCYLNPHDEERPFETSRIHLLIANPSGIYGVYDLRSVQEYKHFYAFGSGEEFALGAMYATYNTDLSAIEVAEWGVRAACEFDLSCQEPIETKFLESD